MAALVSEAWLAELARRAGVGAVDVGEVDLDTLRVVKDYSGLREGKHVDFGVFAAVVEPGLVRVGDAVEPL
jgi:hypothetical protein